MPEESLLLRAVRHVGDLKMPPKGKLPPQAIDGADRLGQVGCPAARSDTVAGNEDAWTRHWAFQPVADPPLPAVRDTAWPRTTVDRFVLARLEAKA